MTFKLEDAQKFLALKSSSRILSENLNSVSTEIVKRPWLAGKIRGYMPPVSWAGAFWTRKGKAFYCVRDRPRCIALKLEKHEYSRVVIEVDDKESIA